MYPKKELAQLVISVCIQYEIDTVVISPGSRNAPLTIGFLNHPKIQALSIVDERCAAFFALGIAQQQQKPVAIICTSGSALLNYYPAIAEAFYSNISLVVISADRPKHLIDIGDGQTIRQENVFENHILYSANLVDAHVHFERNANLIATALHTSIDARGPVHINVPFDEPLYETVTKLKSFQFDNLKFKNVISNAVEKSQIEYTKFSKIWNTSSKKMLLVGVHYPDSLLQEIISSFEKDTSVLLLTETTSNLSNKKGIYAIDQLIFSLNDAEFKELQPELLITLGGMIVSKKVKQFLRKYKPAHHWHIDDQKAMDTYHCLTEFIQEKPTVFLSKLATKSVEIQSGYQQRWLLEKNEKIKKHQHYLNQVEYSDLKVFEHVLNSIPEQSKLQLSNSSIIRYTQLFELKALLSVFCNRGTSGIDGSTSTAIGAAFTTEKQTVFVTGDLSFFYDSNALWNAYIPSNFRIIIVNNGGGGIFRLIPGPKTTNALAYFETPHQLSAEHLCSMYEFEYVSVSDIKNLNIKLMDFYASSDKPKVLEIFTDKEVNEKVLKEYFNFLK